MRGGNLTEKHIHKHFKEYLIRGEWFRDIPLLRKYIKSVKIDNFKKKKSEYITIQISQEVLESITSKRLTPRESYNEILRRLMIESKEK